MRIRDLYAGRPDAKDEFYFDGPESFIKTFVIADHFNLDLLINGYHCFVTGFKGTGKTALLFYLADRLRADDVATCSSFVFFKEDFSDVRRNELQELSRKILSSVAIEPGALIDTTDFEYIWRWILFKRIVSDNEQYERNLFEDDEYWEAFEKTIEQIKDPRDKRKILIPNKIRMAAPIKDSAAMTEVAPELEVDFQKPNSNQYLEFIKLVDKAESAFAQLTRTDVPYYLFVDELEAYYGDSQIFRRDLCMIRDLVFSVKRFNTIFAKMRMRKTKIICSVRSEILTAISRFVVTKEINKVISGFAVPLNWNYTNSNSYAHPIIQILLKRIAVCANCEQESSLDIYRRWFPEEIHGLEPANYILNNSWCKPRDMVRLIATAQSSLHNNDSAFTNVVFSSMAKSYSEDSLQEIREEMRALYTSDEIDSIFSCFTGYRTTFSINELRQRIERFYRDSVLDTHFVQVLNDLYRLGFLGNVFPATSTYHWQHRGDSALIMSDEWGLCIHYALHSALSLRSRNDRWQRQSTALQTGQRARATVTGIIHSFALVDFNIDGRIYKGNIHISEFGNLGYGFISTLSDVVHVGEKYEVVLQEYDPLHYRWKLKLSDNV